MKRAIELKSPELLNYGSEITSTIQEYMNSNELLISTGRTNPTMRKMSDNRCILIHHTEKSVIVEMLVGK